MKKIAIFASGSGTNAEAICRRFADDHDAHVALMVCDRRNAGVFDRMKKFDIPSYYFGREQWRSQDSGGRDGRDVLKLLLDNSIDLVVLAGFLAFVPSPLIEAFKGRMINLHPALLPRHGGPGMWGHHVHEAVLADGDKVSGITVHHVTDEIDGGEIIFQAQCPVLENDTPDTLAERIHILEHQFLPQVVAEMLSK